MTKKLAAIAAILALTACSHATQDKPTHAVKPISSASLHTVVSALCTEPTPFVEQVISRIQDQSPARMRLVLDEIQSTCPHRITDLMRYIGG